jgi:succinoglycan biosynthesis transport protein ExoP
MSNKQPTEPQGAINIGDIYFVLFKHKWLILCFFVLGVLAAGGLLVLKPPQYESEAKLYVQYVMDVKTAVTAPGEEPGIRQTSSGSADIILTELEFLTSLDLAQQVAERVGPDKILAKFGGGSDTNAAAGVILGRLVAGPAPKTPSIILLSFQHPDGDVARTVLSEIIDAYINKSAEQHRTIGTSDEFLDQETKRLREQLQTTEKELSAAKSEAGIISSIEDTRKGWNDEYVQINAELLQAEEMLAERNVDLPHEAKPRLATPSPSVTNAPVEAPASVRDEYQITCSALARAKASYTDGMVKYPPGSDLLRDCKNLVEGLEARKAKLEQQFPQLANLELPAVPSPGSQGAPGPGGPDLSLRLSQIAAKTNYLVGKLAEIRQSQTNLEAREPRIMELSHRKDIQEAALTHFMASLEQSKMGADQGSSGGIKITESPTPAVKKWSKSVKKMVGMALAGGIFGGIGLAFLIEMVLDGTVKRPGEIEKKLHLPLFISIPDTHQNDRRSGRARNGNGNGNGRLLLPAPNAGALVPAGNGSGVKSAPEEIEPWDRHHPLHRFYAGLRDRLIVNFEVRNLSHNPKLVGVTSCRKGAGVSSIAAGLAASLSETGDGNVLLVDMRGEHGAAQHFHKGKPAHGLDADLENGIKNESFAPGNHHAPADDESADHFPSVLSKRFAKLMPQLKASDYDYIIFDMPPVSQTSMTPRLAGLMDMVLLIIESEKTHRDAVQRATALLNESRAQVSTVLNKVKTYVPASLHQEFLDDDV